MLTFRGVRLFSRFSGILAVAALCGAACFLAAPDSEAKGDARVIPLKGKKKVYGRSPGEWSAVWWQWVLSIPSAFNPLYDETGERVEIGQSGDVWFLVGVINESGTATRTATIPEGKALYFPILNNILFDDGAEPRVTEENANSQAAIQQAGIDATSLYLEIDGVPVTGLDQWGVISPVFPLAMPDGNVFNDFFTTSRGVYFPSISNGYWVMIRPLPPGEHTIHSGGTAGSFTIEITYNLTVVRSTVAE